jgi:hypothetical protein
MHGISKHDVLVIQEQTTPIFIRHAVCLQIDGVMINQILITQLMLLLSGGLFYRAEWLPAFTVLAIYVATSIIVVRPRWSLSRPINSTNR